MAAGYPVKVDYVTGDVLTATNLNDLAGTVNLYDPTAKGDLFPAISGTSVGLLPVGANGTTLTADSTAATGMKWAAAGGGGSSGLTLITTGAYSAVSSVNINNCFTSTYTNYFVIINNSAVAANASFSIRFRVSGTDSTTGYYVAGNYNSFSSSTITTTFVNNAAQLMDWGLSTANPKFIYNMDISNPQLATETFYSSAWSKGNTDAGNISGVHQVATAYDGLTIFTATSTITGSYWVYGYAKA